MAFAGVPAAGPERPILGRDLRLSPSQADSYATCPRQYALERRLRLSDSGSPYARFGHPGPFGIGGGGERGGRDREDSCRPGGRPRGIWRGCGPRPTSGLRSSIRPGSHHAAKRHDHGSMRRGPATGCRSSLEMKVETEIDGIEWVGLIDRLEQRPERTRVIDYKTSKNPPSVPRPRSRSSSASMRRL